MKVNRMTGVPWHIETLHLDESDKKRNKARCIFYSKSSELCLARKLKCIGSAHCDKYKEENVVRKTLKKAKWKYTTKLIAMNKNSYRTNICPFCNTDSLRIIPLHCVIFGNEEKTEYIGTVEDAYCKRCEKCGKEFTTVETLDYSTGGISLKRTNLKVEYINQLEIND